MPFTIFDVHLFTKFYNTQNIQFSICNQKPFKCMYLIFSCQIRLISSGEYVYLHTHQFKYLQPNRYWQRSMYELKFSANLQIQCVNSKCVNKLSCTGILIVSSPFNSEKPLSKSASPLSNKTIKNFKRKYQYRCNKFTSGI